MPTPVFASLTRPRMCTWRTGRLVPAGPAQAVPAPISPMTAVTASAGRSRTTNLPEAGRLMTGSSVLVRERQLLVDVAHDNAVAVYRHRRRVGERALGTDPRLVLVATGHMRDDVAATTRIPETHGVGARPDGDRELALSPGERVRGDWPRPAQRIHVNGHVTQR